MSTQNEVLTALRRAAAALASIRQLAALPGFFGKDGRIKAVQRLASDEAHAAFGVSNKSDSAAVYKTAEVLVTEMRVLIALNDTPKLEAIILAWHKASKRQQEEELLGLMDALRRAGLMLVSIHLLDDTWREKWGKTKTEQLGAAEVIARMELEAAEGALAEARDMLNKEA
jgi:hypothetical protein